MDKHKKPEDIIDEDLYEDFDDDELYELVQEERKKALEKSRKRKSSTTTRPFPKWVFWFIAFILFFNILAVIPQTFSIPAIEFLKTSARLSVSDDIQEYKKAVAVIESEDSKGTGFTISSDGYLITNYHVIEDQKQITVAFPKDGLYHAEVVDAYPTIDLAILKVNGDDLPYLVLNEKASFENGDAIRFIGNPLRFNGIANEGNIIDYTTLKDWEEQVIMIKAPVYRGNSGSPILDKEGKVIGVIFATLQHDEQGKVGLFVPIDLFYKYQSHESYQYLNEM